MSILDPVNRAGWLAAVAALEDAGEPVTDQTLGRHLRQRRAHARRQLAKLRRADLVAGLGRTRLTARARWLVGRPVLVYLAAQLEPDPWIAAGTTLALAAELAAAVGSPAAPLMPTREILARAGEGDAASMAVLCAHATRADVVVAWAVPDPLIEGRADVVAAERAAVLVRVSEDSIAGTAAELLRTIAPTGRRP